MSCEFTLSVAGEAVAVKALFASTRDYCREFLTEEAATLTGTVTGEDLPREQQFLDEEADREGLRRRRFPEPFLERNFLQREIARLLGERDILLLHGSAVALDGWGDLFLAPCGTGKSTHARRWREALGARCVNDDKPFVKVGEKVLLSGSPWKGKHGLGENMAVPLQAICCLERGSQTALEPLPAREESLLPYTANGEKDRQAVKKLLQTVPLWRLTCTPTPDAARLCYEALKKSKISKA